MTHMTEGCSTNVRIMRVSMDKNDQKSERAWLRKSNTNVPTSAVAKNHRRQVKYFDGEIHQVRLFSLRYFFYCFIFCYPKEEEDWE